MKKDDFSVMIVDDNRTTLFLTSKIIESHFSNTNVRICQTAKCALNELENNVFNMIIMDIKLGEMNGVDLTSTIRTFHDQTAYILGFTADARISTKFHCLESGMNDVITKPLDVKHLTKIIENLI